MHAGARRQCLWRILAGTVSAVLMLGVAWAHPKLVRSRPAVNASLADPPARIQVWFHEELDTRGSRLTVWNAQRAQVDHGNSTVSLDDRTLIEVGLKPLGPGKYTVKWRAMADDDKGVTQGEFTFTVLARKP